MAKRLDLVDDLDNMMLKQQQERAKQDRNKKIETRYKLSEHLPQDQSLKNQLDIQIFSAQNTPLPASFSTQQILSHLSYYIYMPIELPPYMQEIQSKSLTPSFSIVIISLL